MIIGYAQSETRQGVDAAVDGLVVSSEEKEFARLRSRSASLNAAGTGQLVGDVTVKVAAGLLRIELMGSEPDGADRSPVVIVVDRYGLASSGDAALQGARETIAALGRQVVLADLEAGLIFGMNLQRTATKRRRVLTGIVAVLVAVGVALLVRSIVDADDLATALRL